LVAMTACSSSLVPSSSSSEEPSSSSEPPNGLQPLVPYEDTLEPTIDGGWVSRWADEFNDAELDATKWNIEVNGDGGGNQELQYYRAENVTLDGENLLLTAKKEYYLQKNYTSGRINTKYRMDMLYGRLKVRAKLPGGRGTWAAIWMMPLFNVYGTWPRSGEIDIMEHVGRDLETVHFSLHTLTFNHRKNNHRTYFEKMPTVLDAFHDYEMIWDQDKIAFLVDGQPKATFFKKPEDTVAEWPFDKPYYLILNLAVGGGFGGPVRDEDLPFEMQIRSIRVYQ